MIEKTNTLKSHKTVEVAAVEQLVPSSQVGQDLKNALLIVSLVINLFILSTWIAVQVTSRYDAQLASFLFN